MSSEDILLWISETLLWISTSGAKSWWSSECELNWSSSAYRLRWSRDKAGLPTLGAGTWGLSSAEEGTLISRGRWSRTCSRLLPGWASLLRRRRVWRNWRWRRRWRRTPLPLVLLYTFVMFRRAWTSVFLLLRFVPVLCSFSRRRGRWAAVRRTRSGRVLPLLMWLLFLPSRTRGGRRNDYDVSERQSRKSGNGSWHDDAWASRPEKVHLGQHVGEK